VKTSNHTLNLKDSNLQHSHHSYVSNCCLTSNSTYLICIYFYSQSLR